MVHGKVSYLELGQHGDTWKGKLCGVGNVTYLQLGM